MTIPQGDNRGPQSVTERKKVTFAGSDSTVVSQLTFVDSTSGLDDCCGGRVASGAPAQCQNATEKAHVFSEIEGGAHRVALLSNQAGKHVKESSVESTQDTDQINARVAEIKAAEAKRSPLPLLRFLQTGETSSSSRSRKLSLNLPKSLQNSISITQASDKFRRHSQPQKASYQRVPQEDPSPPNPDLQQHIFTLHNHQRTFDVNKHNLYDQHMSTHDAEVHATFNDKDLDRHVATTSRGSSGGAKKVFFGKIRASSPTKSSSSCRSLDDLSLPQHPHKTHYQQHGGASSNFKSLATHNSASFEDLSTASRRKQFLPSGDSSGNNNTRRLPHESHTSPGSPSHCCLVSVSRVPMAAATSHLTLDSEYQTVRLAVLGAPGVGKSSIVRQFVMQQFLEEYIPTEQRQVFCPAVIINEHLYEVRIIDCPYIPYFPVNSLYEWTDFRGYGLRNATAYVLVYDITSEESFEYIKSLRLQILESRNCHDVPIFVVANKHDLAEERGVARREVREVANMVKKQWKCGYIECSAKYNWHIVLLFKELMKTVDYIDYGHKPTSMRVQDALRRNRCLIL